MSQSFCIAALFYIKSEMTLKFPLKYFSELYEILQNYFLEIIFHQSSILVQWEIHKGFFTSSVIAGALKRTHYTGILFPKQSNKKMHLLNFKIKTKYHPLFFFVVVEIWTYYCLLNLTSFSNPVLS